jgi:hypothetical protein
MYPAVVVKFEVARQAGEELYAVIAYVQINIFVFKASP